MDSESVDLCMRKVLSSLYPPFRVTSETVLSQVLSVINSCYRGDIVRFLLHFLLPAKHLLETLQQHNFVPSCDEGWPLCIQGKLVVHLCPLDQRLLHPGDFYLQVSLPPGSYNASCRSSVSPSPRLLLCSITTCSSHVEQQELSEVALRSLFSMAWLDSANRERERRGATRLERCVLVANTDVFRVPWEDLVYPQLLSRSRTVHKQHQEVHPVDSSTLEDVQVFQPLKTELSSSEAEDSEGEYVELSELEPPTEPCLSPQRGSLTLEISRQLRARGSTHTFTLEDTDSHKHTLEPHEYTYTTEDAHLPHNTQLSDIKHTLTDTATDAQQPQYAQHTSRLSEEAFTLSCTSSSSSWTPPVVTETSSGQPHPEEQKQGMRKEENENAILLEEEEEQECVSGHNAIETEKEDEEEKHKGEEIAELLTVQGSHEEKEDQEEMMKDRRSGGEEEEGAGFEDSYYINSTPRTNTVDCCSEKTSYINPNLYSKNTSQTNSGDCYHGNITKPQAASPGNTPQRTNPEDFYCGNATQAANGNMETNSEVFYCENITWKNSVEFIKTNPAQRLSSEETCCDNTTRRTNSDDLYCESVIQSNSYCAIETQPTNSGSSCSEGATPRKKNKRRRRRRGRRTNSTSHTFADTKSNNTTPRTSSEKSYCENEAQTNIRDSCKSTQQSSKSVVPTCNDEPERNTSQDSCFDITTQKEEFEDFYCEENTCLNSGDTCENNKQNKNPEDPFCDRAIMKSDPNNPLRECPSKKSSGVTDGTNSEDTFCENNSPPDSEDFYCERNIQPGSKEFFCENSILTNFMDSCCKDTFHRLYSNTDSDQFCCKNMKQGTRQLDESCCINVKPPPPSEECMLTVSTWSQVSGDVNSNDSYFENTAKVTNSEETCDRITQGINVNVLYCKEENKKAAPDEPYCENTTNTQDSDCENFTQKTNLKDSFCKNMVKGLQPEDICCENTYQTSSDFLSGKNLEQTCENLRIAPVLEDKVWTGSYSTLKLSSGTEESEIGEEEEKRDDPHQDKGEDQEQSKAEEELKNTQDQEEKQGKFEGEEQQVGNEQQEGEELEGEMKQEEKEVEDKLKCNYEEEKEKCICEEHEEEEEGEQHQALDQAENQHLVERMEVEKEQIWNNEGEYQQRNQDLLVKGEEHVEGEQKAVKQQQTEEKEEEQKENCNDKDNKKEEEKDYQKEMVMCCGYEDVKLEERCSDLKAEGLTTDPTDVQSEQGHLGRPADSVSITKHILVKFPKTVVSNQAVQSLQSICPTKSMQSLQTFNSTQSCLTPDLQISQSAQSQQALQSQIFSQAPVQTNSPQSHQSPPLLCNHLSFQSPQVSQHPKSLHSSKVLESPQSGQMFNAPQIFHSPQSTKFPHSPQFSKSSQSTFYSLLLNSGAVCLPGSTDRNGRALITVSTWSSVWSHPDCDGADLLHLLLHYSSTLREEMRALGLTVLVDARRTAPVPAIFSALRCLQEKKSLLHTVLLLVNKDSSLMRLDKRTLPQVEVLMSLKSLDRQVALQQVPTEFGGSFSFSHSSWLCYKSRVELLTKQCQDVIKLLQETINTLQTTPLPAAAQDAELLSSRYKSAMSGVLADSRLVQLQQEGGASLSWLRREAESKAWSAPVETVSSLYNQVDELLHCLVTLSNTRTRQLSFILDFSSQEEELNEVSSWLQQEAEPRLKNLTKEEEDDSLQLVIKKEQQFKELFANAQEYCKRGEALLKRLGCWEGVSTADLHVYEVRINSFSTLVQSFSERLEATGQNLQQACQLYRFLDQAYGWALAGLRHLAGVSMEECTLPNKCQAVIDSLQDYQSQHPPITDARFQEMKAEAEKLQGERGLHQWSFAWSKCQETSKMFDRKLETALKTRDAAQRRSSVPSLSPTSSARKTELGYSDSSSSSSSLSCSATEDVDITPPPRSSSFVLPRSFSPISSTPVQRRTPLLSRLNSTSSRKQQLRKTHSFDCPPTPEASRYGACPRAHSEPVRRGNIGVFIRGLEVSSTEAADRTLCPRMPAHRWAGPGARSSGMAPTEARPRGSKLCHIMEEMVTTEREYVRSLRYIIIHYFPEMERPDLPQDLRGKRSVIFGNLEKLLDFHSQFFLRELESCWKHPLRVSHCFLRHQEQFALYALYSKNKPKSDILLANHGNSFFRRKQLELGDKMDLSSYLLKPIQRMSKYALLLNDIIKEVGVSQEAELSALQAAAHMVKFQLRHGNDLLAMDAIRDCDVNLKEQGQLIRQEEVTVWSGRKKCQRHIFLFEELLLLSKAKKMEGGLDVFIYKHSFKTADIGLTESSGDTGLRFEIWFRRRTKAKNQTLVLQAATALSKQQWTSDIARILWRQATRSKELRQQEMVNMGVGSKPFMDIQPSDAAISDRAVHYIMKSRGARTRASIAVSVLDHINPFKRGVVTSDLGTSGSSSSLLGSLDLHMLSQSLLSTDDSSFMSSCVEEDEQEHETSSQPSMTTESSGSSSRCLSGSTGSDSGCVSTLQAEEQQLHSSLAFMSTKPAAVIGPSTVI